MSKRKPKPAEPEVPAAFRSGFVAIIGRPNVGKSTLVNRLVGQKVSIVTARPQTTRNRILGIVNRPDAQVVFVDTPGLQRPDSLLGRHMMDELKQALDGVDLICVMIDASQGLTRQDRFALGHVAEMDAPIFLLLNKIDRVTKPALLPMLQFLARERDFAEMIPISALNGDGVESVLKSITARLPEGQPYFPTDQFTDQPERFLAAEIIREKAMSATRQEVPQALTVLVESWEEGQRLTRISALLQVEREGQKGILIGKRGEKLKTIGTEARLELEKILGTKIFLELFVKVQSDWRGDPRQIRRLDWRRQLEETGKVDDDLDDDPEEELEDEDEEGEEEAELDDEGEEEQDLEKEDPEKGEE